MIVVGNVIASDDIAEKEFVCNLNACKGACCEEGDLGAPLEEAELKEILDSLPHVKNYLSGQHQKHLDKLGAFQFDVNEKEYHTRTVNNKACVFAYKNELNHWSCSFEAAWKEGKTTFRKPISCHLYPIRAQHYDQYIALNYDRWDICNPACTLGYQLKVPVYLFLREALERKFGKEWFLQLEEVILEKQKSSK